MSERRYRAEDKHQYEPPPCPRCGGPTRVEWVSCDTSDDVPGTWFVPGMVGCDNCVPYGDHPVRPRRTNEPAPTFTVTPSPWSTAQPWRLRCDCGALDIDVYADDIGILVARHTEAAHPAQFLSTRGQRS